MMKKTIYRVKNTMIQNKINIITIKYNHLFRFSGDQQKRTTIQA